MPSQATTTSQQPNLIEFDSAANAISKDKTPTPEEASRLKLAVEKLAPDQKGWLLDKIADTPIEDEAPELFDLEDEKLPASANPMTEDALIDKAASNINITMPNVDQEDKPQNLNSLHDAIRKHNDSLDQTKYAQTVARDGATKRYVTETSGKLDEGRQKIVADFRQAVAAGVDKAEVEGLINSLEESADVRAGLKEDLTDVYAHDTKLKPYLKGKTFIRKEPENQPPKEPKINPTTENDDNFTINPINPPITEAPTTSIEPAKPVEEIAPPVETIIEKETEPAPVMAEPVAATESTTEPVAEPKLQEPEVTPQAKIETVVEPELKKEQSPILDWLDVVNAGKEGGLTAATVAGKGPGAVEPQGQEDRK